MAKRKPKAKIIPYNKLVRDKVPARIQEQGHEVKTRKANVREYGNRLIDKLCEEVVEFLDVIDKKKGRDCVVEELVDIVTAIDALLKHWGITKTEFRRAFQQKAKANGLFNNRTILLQVIEKK